MPLVVQYTPLTVCANAPVEAMPHSRAANAPKINDFFIALLL
jgi:hypothetical protein